MSIRIPPAEVSVTVRRAELGGAPRWQVYLAKIAQGAFTAIGLGLVWVILLRFVVGVPREEVWSTMKEWPTIALLGAATLAIVVAEKTVDTVIHKYWMAFNPLDCIFDCALHQAWLLPFEWQHVKPLFVVHVLCFALYPWSQE